MRDVPTVHVDHLTSAQIRAYVIADNKLAENAGWDRALLALELQELSVELNFDVTVTGLEVAEIDLLIQDLKKGAPDEADEVPEVDRSVPAVSRRGDLWCIGNHVLLCGDALDKGNYAKLLGAKKAQMVFTLTRPIPPTRTKQVDVNPGEKARRSPMPAASPPSDVKNDRALVNRLMSNYLAQK